MTSETDVVGFGLTARGVYREDYSRTPVEVFAITTEKYRMDHQADARLIVDIVLQIEEREEDLDIEITDDAYVRVLLSAFSGSKKGAE